MSTTENLMAAFAGESQANRKYLAFAKKAEAEGFPQIAKLFRAAAEAETIHAHAHLRVLDGVKGTEANLMAAIEGEGHEFKDMYPEFLKDAEAEGDKKAHNSFRLAYEVEKVHEELYREMLALLEGNKTSEEFDYYVCPVCGYVHKKSALEKCPVCGCPGARFEKIS